MKRLIPFISCLLVFLGGIAAALSVCDKISIAAGDNRPVSVSRAAYDHHSDSAHEHSHNATVACPTVEQYVPTAVFSPKPNLGPERLVNSFVAELDSRISDGGFRRLIHGPPLARSSGIPSPLFLSVLRI